MITSKNNVSPTVAESLRPKVKPPGVDAWALGFLGLGNNTHGPNPTSSCSFAVGY